MDHLSVQNYPENARIPIRGPFYDLAQKEVFFPVNIDGYRDIYRVSQFGKVMSTRDVKGTHFGKVLSPSISCKGYRRVSLAYEGTVKYWRINRLVLLTFIGPPQTEAHQGAHFDGNSMNDSVFNLRWATPKQNTADKWQHGTMAKGESQGMAKLTEAQILYIHAAYRSGKNTRELADELGVGTSTIKRILRGENWGHLGLRTETRGVKPNSITDEQVQHMFTLRAQGLLHREIANTIGCSRAQVGIILTGKSRSFIQE